MSRWFKARGVRRDYSQKTFTNPLFARAPRHDISGARRWRTRLLVVTGFFAVMGWTWFIAFSSAFRITDIQVKGNDRIPAWEIRDTVTEALATRRWLVLPQSGILIASKETIVAALNERYVLETLTVTKTPPHTLTIELKERISAVLLQMSDGGQGLVDLQGTVTRLYAPEEALDVIPKQGPTLEEQQGKSRTSYPVLYDDKHETIKLREKAVRPEVIAAVISLPKLLETRLKREVFFSQAHIDGKSAQTLRVVTSAGWAIYVDATADLAEQMKNAEMILRTKIGNDRSDLDYIDVRFGDKIFFKLKS